MERHEKIEKILVLVPPAKKVSAQARRNLDEMSNEQLDALYDLALEMAKVKERFNQKKKAEPGEGEEMIQSAASKLVAAIDQVIKR